MDLLQYFLGGTSLRIVESGSLFRKWAALSVVRVEIMASATTSELPQAVTSAQITEVFEGSVKANVAATKIIMPTGMVITTVCPDQSTLDNIIASWKDTAATFDITSRNIIANNMALTEIEIDQDEENISSQKVVLTFEQTNVSRPSLFNPIQDADRDMLGISTKQPVSLLTTARGLYNSISAKLGL